MSEGYELVRLDELEALPTASGPTFRPVRRRLGIRAFGINGWTGEKVGDDVIERHSETDGPEELYVVLEGRAAFTLGDDTVDAPVGTVVSAPPGTLRGAEAAEPHTTVLAIGAPVGEAYRPLAYEDTYVAFGYQRQGDDRRAREVMREALERHADDWRAHFNAACFEALAGAKEPALAHLRRAAELNPAEVRKYARTDADFDSLRGDPAFEDALA